MSKTVDTRIPQDYDLRKVMEKMLYILWIRNGLGESQIREIIEAGGGR